MHAQVARVMKGLVVKPPQLMETLSALVRKAGLEMTALWMSMSAMKVLCPHVSMEVLALTPRAALSVTVLMDSPDHAVKPTSTSVSRIPARIREPVWICPGCSDVYVCQDTQEQFVKKISMSVSPAPVRMEACVKT